MQQKLDEITATVENARSMPMSASIVVNKSEMAAMLAELREALPTELAQAQQTVEQGDQVVEEARREAERIIAAAHEERARLVAGTDLVVRAQAEADRLLAEARAESEEERREADDYVDSKLANFEVVLTKTLGALGRGRAKLRTGGMPVEGEDGEEFAQDAFHSPSPEVDDYVDVKLAALETALGKTLEAVGRGRDKLLGKRPIDDLGAYLEAADHASGVTVHGDRHSAVAAELASAGLLPEPDAAQEHAGQEHPGQQQPEYWPPQQPQLDPNGYPYQQEYQLQGQLQPQQAQSGYEQQQPGYDAYGYQQPQPGYDPYAYPQQPEYDPYVQPQPHLPQQQQGQGLDETSFFDTGFIDVSKLREFGGYQQ
ncbi:cell division initiation protein [Streptacidiphilus sp. P02-A3a]|uniref:cell division initiation protein n=1 Tax=Streptacidiphilus sp. P02-A3a TaxID=2704468 RepID=UPI00351A4387